MNPENEHFKNADLCVKLKVNCPGFPGVCICVFMDISDGVSRCMSLANVFTAFLAYVVVLHPFVQGKTGNS